MLRKVKWGVLGTAKIALEKVIPSIQQGEISSIIAIASRSADRARKAASDLNIRKSYGSYEELLSDSEIDVVYNPLPNHLHLPWTINAARSGKHVLCEKPVGLSADETREMLEVQDQTGVKIQEAFMVRTHPKWLAVRDLIENGRIGKLRSIAGFFSYHNIDESNIRNKLELGGGALMDIGCYCINISRFVFGREPEKVAALIDRDARTGVDTLTSVMLDFSGGHSSFTCSTQMVPYQRMHFFGTKGRIEVQIPFNIPLETPTFILIDDGSDLYGENIERIEFPVDNQYLIQGEMFSRAVSENLPQPIPLEDSLKNMSVIDAVFRAAKTGKWEAVESHLPG